MVALKLPVFSGMVPSIDRRLLNDQNAAYARDTWLYSGALHGLPAKALLHELVNPAAAKAFRIPGNMGDPTYLYDSYWLEFENPNTDFVSAPVAADQFDRFYWTSTSQAPAYNTRQRILNGDPPFLLGIPSPTDLSVTITGGSSTTMVSRAYLATLVSEYGEEGPASNPVLVNGKVDATYDVELPSVAASDMGVQRNIKKIRLYRTITSAAGVATYHMVAEVDAATTAQTYSDTMTDAALSSRPILESLMWSPPPNLDGLAVMPNGIMAGYKDNELFFSEAYRPHAWPASYALMLEFNIVGLAVINQTLVVCTQGNPYTASGVNPGSITTARLASFEPCLSKGSIVATEEGVFYASPNGLIVVNPGFAQNITKQFITKDQWDKVVNQGQVNAGRVGGSYYAFGTGVPRISQKSAFQIDMIQQEDEVGSGEGFLLDASNPNVGFAYLEDASEIKSVYNDAFSGELLLVKDGAVHWLDQRPGYQTEPYIWRSKEFHLPKAGNFSAFKLYFYEPKDREYDTPPNYDKDQVFDPETQIGVVRVYADGKLVMAHEVRKPGELHRLPSGFKAEMWQIEFEATVKITSFQMATSVKELSVA